MLTREKTPPGLLQCDDGDDEEHEEPEAWREAWNNGKDREDPGEVEEVEKVEQLEDIDDKKDGDKDFKFRGSVILTQLLKTLAMHSRCISDASLSIFIGHMNASFK